ncbi:uncharacterized protein BDR25DRAFT_362520 [Lindgomyces ingoldianus]|uniref:Uncharacterized protein n=1 Tax=Lindgomyces ingoldianus TaxID=673940 RepID=A0ACB6QC71_9PLEO|nr:uncharacterized protein BDR25DRAFT_362520 [Lindgomyces ingoldianus]KAF2463717.1 hypothetical protein BDR25DRAFT_362520 [Lindgomyces ingoldianus]
MDHAKQVPKSVINHPLPYSNKGIAFIIPGITSLPPSYHRTIISIANIIRFALRAPVWGKYSYRSISNNVSYASFIATGDRLICVHESGPNCMRKEIASQQKPHPTVANTKHQAGKWTLTSVKHKHDSLGTKLVNLQCNGPQPPDLDILIHSPGTVLPPLAAVVSNFSFSIKIQLQKPHPASRVIQTLGACVLEAKNQSKMSIERRKQKTSMRSEALERPERNASYYTNFRLASPKKVETIPFSIMKIVFISNLRYQPTLLLLQLPFNFIINHPFQIAARERISWS